MQKIVFVGIILIIGLFSLQFALSTLYHAPVVSKQAHLDPEITVQPVIYVIPADSTVCVSPEVEYLQKL